MLPTDHAELLERSIYPLAAALGAPRVASELERAIAEACRDALGVYCAHQCFYIQLVNEREGRSPLKLDRAALPRILGAAFAREEESLRSVTLRPGDLAAQRSYRVTVSGMRILSRDYGIDWGVAIPIDKLSAADE